MEGAYTSALPHPMRQAPLVPASLLQVSHRAGAQPHAQPSEPWYTHSPPTAPSRKANPRSRLDSSGAKLSRSADPCLDCSLPKAPTLTPLGPDTPSNHHQPPTTPHHHPSPTSPDAPVWFLQVPHRAGATTPASTAGEARSTLSANAAPAAGRFPPNQKLRFPPMRRCHFRQATEAREMPIHLCTALFQVLSRRQYRGNCDRLD